MSEISVAVPRDVEADLILELDALNVSASTLVPDDVAPGTVRVSRIGGDLVYSDNKDNPLIVVEVWAENAPAAFDRAREVYAAFKVIEWRGTIRSGISVTGMDIQTPRALDDPNQPKLYHVQFTVQFVIELEQIVMKVED